MFTLYKRNRNGLGTALMLFIAITLSTALTTQAQDVFSGGESIQSPDRETVRMMSPATTIDRERLLQDFTEEEIVHLRGISPEIFERFDTDELRTILAYDFRDLQQRSAVEDQVLSRYEDFQQELAESGGFELMGLMNVDMGHYFDFTEGSVSGWDIEDVTGSGEVWQPSSKLEYGPHHIADSDANSSAHVHTVFASEAIQVDNLSGDRIGFYLSHDYRHLTSSATLEWSINGTNWSNLDTWESNSRYQQSFYDITEKVGPSDVFYIRFVYNDNDNWAWWWGLDKAAIFGYSADEVFAHEPSSGTFYNNNEFEKVSENVYGVINQVSYDLELLETLGDSYTVGYAVLFTDGNDIDNSPRILQIGGEFGSGVDQFVPWDGALGTGPISGTVLLDEPVDVSGLTMWVGHRGFSEGRWGGEISLEGSAFTSSIPTLSKQTFTHPGIGLPSGSFNDYDFFVAENVVIQSYEKLTGVTAFGLDPNNRIAEDDILDGVRVYLYHDDNGVPAGSPLDGGAIYSTETVYPSDIVTVFQDGDIRQSVYIDIEAVATEDWLVSPGNYWLVFATNQSASAANYSNRWSQGFADPQNANAMFLDPSDLVGTGEDGWVDVEMVYSQDLGLAYALHGIEADAPPLEPITPQGLFADLNSDNGEVTLSWATPPSEGFIENFNDGTAEGFEFTDEFWSVEDGYLQRINPESDPDVGIAYNDMDYGDFFLEAEIKSEIDGPSAAIAGLVFRSDAVPSNLDGIQNGYLAGILHIDEGVLFSLFMIDGDSFRVIREWGPSENLNADPEGSNFISVSANGDVFDVYLNGNYEASFVDATHPTGKIGVLGASSNIYTFDYIAAIASSLPVYRNPVMHSVSPAEPGRSLFQLDTESLRAASDQNADQRAGVTNPSGMFSQYGEVGLQGLMAEDFVTFSVYRDGALIGTTPDNTFTDNLDDFGLYEYRVSAQYQFGESELSAPRNVIYANTLPVERQKAEVSEDGFTAELETNSGVWSESFMVTNTGELDLLFSLEESIAFSSGPIVTGFGVGAGGADVSVLQESIGMASFGAGVQAEANNRVATRMVLTEGWALDTFSYYVYQTNSGTTPTITSANLRIWDGEPGNGGSVIFGDASTDVLSSVEFSNIYRVPEGNESAESRPVMEAILDVDGLDLEAGTYWVDVQFDGDLSSGPWMPPVTVLDRPVTGNGDAVQYTANTDSWIVFGSGVYEQSFPYTYSGSIQNAVGCWDSGAEWLSVDVLSGSLNPEASQELTLSVDTDGLEPGDYSTNVCVFTNDENNQLVAIPVSITIESDADPVQASAPVFSPDPGAYELTVDVSMSTETDDAQVFYTIDGTDPDDSSTEYTGPVTVTETTTFRAIALSADDMILDSDITVATYTISQPGEPAFVQFINNSADPMLAEVEMGIGDEGQIYCWGQGRCASSFAEVESGTEQTFTVTLPGSDDVLAEISETFTAGESYTIILQGVEDPSAFAMNPTGADIGLEMLVFSGTADSSDREEDEVSFFVVHNSTDAPDVNLTVKDGQTLAINVGYGDRTNKFTVARDSYVIEVRNAGNNAVLFDYTVDLSSADGTYAILASGFVNPAENQNGPGFTLLSVDAEGDISEFPQATSTGETDMDLPAMVELSQNYPNPFNPTTQIQFALPESGEVRLEVFNVNGQRVAVLAEGQHSAGRHSVSFDAERLSSGMYLYRLQTGSTVEVRKMMLVK